MNYAWTGCLAALLLGAAPAAGLDLTRDGKPAAVLVTPDRPSEMVARAAWELQHHAEKAGGAKLAVVRLADAAGVALPKVFVGVPFDGFDAGALPRQGARLEARGGDLRIVGRDAPAGQAWLKQSSEAGTLFAVYMLMEKHWGVRWLWPGELGEVVPAAPTLSFPDEARTLAPPLQLATWRVYCPPEGWDNAENHAAFVERQAVWLRRHRFHMNGGLFNYPHGIMADWKRFASLEETPDFFNLLPDGTRRPDPLASHGAALHYCSMCVSNPAFHQAIVADFLAHRADARPLMNLNENDASGKCVCDNCLAWDESPVPAAERRAAAARRFAEKDAQWHKELGDLSARYAKFYQAVLAEADRQAPGMHARARQHPRLRQLSAARRCDLRPPRRAAFLPARHVSLERDQARRLPRRVGRVEPGGGRVRRPAQLYLGRPLLPRRLWPLGRPRVRAFQRRRRFRGVGPRCAQRRIWRAGPELLSCRPAPVRPDRDGDGRVEGIRRRLRSRRPGDGRVLQSSENALRRLRRRNRRAGPARGRTLVHVLPIRRAFPAVGGAGPREGMARPRGAAGRRRRHGGGAGGVRAHRLRPGGTDD